MASKPRQDQCGSGSWALRGFEYQRDVSVWLALDLMVAARLTSEMTLEHVSEEDVEADVDEFEPGTVADAVPMGNYRLIVQLVMDLSYYADHGGKQAESRRASTAEMLANLPSNYRELSTVSNIGKARQPIGSSRPLFVTGLM